MSSFGQVVSTTAPGRRGGGLELILSVPVAQVIRTRHWMAVGRMVNSGVWNAPEPLKVVTVSHRAADFVPAAVVVGPSAGATVVCGAPEPESPSDPPPQPVRTREIARSTRTVRRPMDEERTVGPMLYAFGFERLAVLVGDLYFVNPRPLDGQEGPERGVRLELRMLERRPLQGGIYSAQPIGVERPLWRVDLLESVDSPRGQPRPGPPSPVVRRMGARFPPLRPRAERGAGRLAGRPARRSGGRAGPGRRGCRRGDCR